MTTSALERLTVDEYLAIERAAETKSEFFDGEMFAMSGGSEAHNLISQNIGSELRSALKGRPCWVYPSDMRVKAPTGLYTYPDVSVACGERQFEGNQRDNLLNPIVVIEVLSPSTEAYDRGKKFEHYRSIPSVQAYVLIAQDHRSVEHFARQPDGRWLLTAVTEGAVEFPSLNCEVTLDEIYAQVEFPPQSETNSEAPVSDGT